MQLSEIKQIFNIASNQQSEIMSMIDFSSLEEEIKALDQQTYDQAFWDDNEKANKVIQALKILKNKYDKITSLNTIFEEIKLAYEFIQMGEDMSEEFEELCKKLDAEYNILSVELLLTEDFDKLNAVFEIHPGAGGTESQDWADMLFRMYSRYAELYNYKFEVLDYLKGDEAGIKSVTFSITGPNAYGFLKSESGVHRLVRISPFDSGGRRHTSFASCNVIPEIDDSINVEINDKDLKIDTYRSSGAGGQSVNTTDSAVRITHLPTKTVVSVQNERSQIKNREHAMKILKSKLYKLELERKHQEISSFRSNSVANAFGSQIRSYVMHPYSMVKDHRTNVETGNVSKVLDGELSMFISGYLKMKAKGEL